MTTRRFDCLVAGDANVDLLVEGPLDLEPGTEKQASDVNLVLGGSSAITAFNLSRLGSRVTFAGVIGQDEFGRLVEEKLSSGGVDLTGLRRIAGSKTGLTIWHTASGKRAGVTYPGTIAMLKSTDITSSLLEIARHLHLGAYFLQTQLHSSAPELFAHAHRLGLTTSLDCNYDPETRWDSNLLRVLPHLDFFFPNEDEALRVSGQSSTVEAARFLAAIGNTVVVKCGAKGALVARGNELYSVPAAPACVVETTGAGDSFNAGFLSEFLRGSTLQVCMQAATQAGARCTERVGGTAAFE
jgi:sugar/nucleoside kinase (ribokinase family)